MTPDLLRMWEVGADNLRACDFRVCGGADDHPRALDLHLLPCFPEVVVSLAVVVSLKRKRVLKTVRGIKSLLKYGR